jgi:hypothetical protein
MKKSKIFLSAAALVLAISAVFATKANKKFGTGTKTAYGPSGSKVVWSSAIFTTSKVSGAVQVGVQLLTAASNYTTYEYLYTQTGTSGHPLYVVL